MKNRQILVYALVLAVLLVLIYFQFRTWRNFDWKMFFSETGNVDGWGIVKGVVLIYLAYVLRTLRWAIFLRPVRKTKTAELLNPTVIGFTALALLGRAAEPVRPFLIGRRIGLSFSSQLAVWAIERIFDIGGFAILLISVIFLADAPKDLPYYERFREAGFVIVCFVAVSAMGAAIVSWKGQSIADWIASSFPHMVGHHIALRIREFRGGLNTIHSFAALVQLIAASLGMWGIIVLAYWEIMQSYGPGPLQQPLSVVPLLVASSMAGSLIQLPGVGGGSQLATISVLQHVFNTPHELAASCGILIWLTTMVSIVPLGLVLAHRERVSLRKLSDESQSKEEGEVAGSPL